VKIVLVVSSFPKLSETFVVNKFLGLLDKGWDVHVVCSTSKQAEWLHYPELEQRADLRRRVHVNSTLNPLGLVALAFPLLLLRCLIVSPTGTLSYLYQGWSTFGVDVFRRFYLDAELIALKPSLIHFEFGAWAVGRMYLKELLDCRVIASFRGYDLNYVGLESENHYAEVWEKTNALHFLGEDLWQRAQRRGCSPNKTRALIPPAVDTHSLNHGVREHTEVVGTSERPLRILSVGRLEWKKGYSYALQAVKLLIKEGVCCEHRIIGAGAYVESVAFARHQLGLEGVVDLVGARPHTETLKSMIWADVFLHAAVSEGFCNAVQEAQAMALPVVCTDADGLRENIADGQTGYIVPRRDPPALMVKLRLLAQDPHLRQQMGQAGRRRVQTHFRLEDQLSSFEDLYRKVLASEATSERAQDGQMLAAAHGLEKR
jgi:colanic acid/amylovoran biosynthesis glycosyltransferase